MFCLSLSTPLYHPNIKTIKNHVLCVIAFLVVRACLKLHAIFPETDLKTPHVKANFFLITMTSINKHFQYLTLTNGINMISDFS